MLLQSSLSTKSYPSHSVFSLLSHPVSGQAEKQEQDKNDPNPAACAPCVGASLGGKESNQNIMSFANNIVDSMIIFGQHVYERVHKEGKLKY